MKFERHNSSNQAASISAVSEPLGTGQKRNVFKASRTHGIKRRRERDCFISIPEHFSMLKLTSAKWNYWLSDLEWWSCDKCRLLGCCSECFWGTGALLVLRRDKGISLTSLTLMPCFLMYSRSLTWPPSAKSMVRIRLVERSQWILGSRR